MSESQAFGRRDGVNVPLYEIKIAGNSYSQAEPNGLEYMMIEDHLDKIGIAEFTINTQGSEGQMNSARAIPIKLGDEVEVKVGRSGRKMFVGKVSDVQHTMVKGRNQVSVQAMDPLMEAANNRKTRTWEDVTDADVVGEVLGEYTAGTVDATSVTRAYTFQRNESDFHFLRRLASRNGYLLYCEEGKIEFKKPQYSGSVLDIPREQVMDLGYQRGQRSLPETVRVVGWNYANKEMIEGTATKSDIQAIGGGSAASAAPEVSFKGEKVISDVQVADQAEAKEMAVAELNRLAREMVKGTATVNGRGDLYAGVMIKFSGQPSGRNPTLLVESARHRVSNRTGLVTELSFCGNQDPT